MQELCGQCDAWWQAGRDSVSALVVEGGMVKKIDPSAEERRGWD
jgi:hypothetical protein